MTYFQHDRRHAQRFHFVEHRKDCRFLKGGIALGSIVVAVFILVMVGVVLGGGK